MRNTKRRFLSKLPLLLFFFLACSSRQEDIKVLVFSKTMGFRHESIAEGIQAIKKLGREHHFYVKTTEDADDFYEENLRKFNAIIFLNTTGDVLNTDQQNDFERYIRAGGGFVGVHAATDTEYDWPWYGKLVGAYFHSHPNNPNVRHGDFIVVDPDHTATDSLPERWTRSDEFYNFKDINPEIKVLVRLMKILMKAELMATTTPCPGITITMEGARFIRPWVTPLKHIVIRCF